MCAKKAKITVDKEFKIGEVDKRLFGSFTEHLGRVIYNGIHEPEHVTADEYGFRNDVIEVVKEIGVPVVRYPGGNFVSGYRWEDGVGPVEKRPARWDKTWRRVEPNTVGIKEFNHWAKKINAEVMMAVNLGTRGPEDAANLLEYCNFKEGTYYSDLRKSHGSLEPYSYKLWCLGNEMDGFWQLGHKTSEEYGRIAHEAAVEMRRVDPDIELVVCGSTAPWVSTFPVWDSIVLDHTYEDIDYISLHRYYDILENDHSDFLGSSVNMDWQIDSIISTCDYVKAKKRSKKSIYLSFDEWNVSFDDRRKDPKTFKIHRETYTLGDALVFATMMNSLLRHADRIKIGCQSNLVNAIAPIKTVPGGKAWRQTIFYPYMYASRYGRGTSLNLLLNSPLYDAKNWQDVPYVDATAVYSPPDNDEFTFFDEKPAVNGELTFFIVNRDLEDDVMIDFDIRQFSGWKLEEHLEIYHDDISAINTPENEFNVVPAKVNGKVLIDSVKMTASLNKHSWNMIRLKK